MIFCLSCRERRFSCPCFRLDCCLSHNPYLAQRKRGDIAKKPLCAAMTTFVSSIGGAGREGTAACGMKRAKRLALFFAFLR